MVKGIVKWFNNKKGYGFITMDDGKDIFAHYTCIQGEGYKSLQHNETVEFEIGQGPKGDQATNIKTIEKVNPIKEIKEEEKS